MRPEAGCRRGNRLLCVVGERYGACMAQEIRIQLSDEAYEQLQCAAAAKHLPAEAYAGQALDAGLAVIRFLGGARFFFGQHAEVVVEGFGGRPTAVPTRSERPVVSRVEAPCRGARPAGAVRSGPSLTLFPEGELLGGLWRLLPQERWVFGCLGEGVTQAFAGPGIRQVGAALGVMAQGLVGSGGDLAAYGVDAGHGAAQASGGYGVDRVLCEVLRTLPGCMSVRCGAGWLSRGTRGGWRHRRGGVWCSRSRMSCGSACRTWAGT